MTYEAWRITYQSSEQAARAAYAECVRLRARIEAMEKQEPIGWITEDYQTDKSATTYNYEAAERWRKKGWPVSNLYALPGAKGEEK